MKLVVLQENLKKALLFVNKVVSVKTQLPVLGNVLLETEEGRVKISGTNLETTISYWVGAQIEKTGKTTVPARFLTELISSFSQEKVTLSLDKTLLTARCGESEATLSGIGAEEFPPLPQPTGEKSAEVQRKALEEGLAFVLVSASTDEGRPILTGVRFTEGQGDMVMVATDGYRLSVKHLLQVAGLKAGVVIPGRALSEVAKAIVEEGAEKIDVYFSEDKNQIIFSLPHIQIATRLIEGDYPPYQKIIPSSFTTSMTVGKEEFLRAVRFAAVYAKESANIIRFHLDAKGKLVVSANSPQVGENKTTLDVKIEGEGGEIAFNARFLLDLLSVFPGKDLVLEMTGPLAPGVFKVPGDDSYLHIIMPVRVQN